ncbi:periplasmic protease [Bernardetia litoralis DSM 6794]|uniref:Periplasmic protease n=1 Tax=Bernardetia litoralis (strain ATCC 23117 / DSM 6794 / NBRC 15988 / NCIMB 1366 / Fx l1 / Sio-4) TaxID=880071 RepID=I4AN09_BERLS|nr:S41 family peptidase [Bernardetia litoralis]AFM05344.1 periplasmic protease [Bernardetia litoralis DSM 6794]
MYSFQSKLFILLSILFLFIFSTSVLAQRKPERIIEKEEVEKFKATLDSALCLYTTDSIYRKPILEIGNNPFLDSLIEYNLQEYAFYLNNYWYELDNNTALSLENTAPQGGFKDGDNEKLGFYRKSSLCNCGREHEWHSGWWKGEKNKIKSDNETHYVYYKAFWWRLRSYNRKNFYNRMAQGKSLFRRGVIKRGRRKSKYKTNVWNNNYNQFNLDYLGNGFDKKEILEGNIGYLKCSFLASANYINERFLKDLIEEFLFTDALILDLRGSSVLESERKFFTKDKTINEMSVPIWFVERFLRPDTTYNLGTAKVFHTREYLKDSGKPRRKNYENPTIPLTTETEEVKSFFKRDNYWSYHWGYPLEVDKNYEKYYTLRYFERPIYILTDRNTSDAAEWIVQVLQKHRNAIVIGEPTKGQSTITKRVGTSAYSWLNIPDIEIETTEKSGVKPDIFVSSYDTTSIDKPFDIAYKMAYEKSVLRSNFSYIKKYGQRFKQFEEIIKPIPNPYNLPKNAKDLLGNYGLGKEIIFKNGKLWLKNYQHISPIYQTAPNTFLVKNGLQKRVGHTSYETVAKPIYLFFRKSQDDFQANQISIDSTLEIKQDSVMNMFVRYGDFTSAKFTQLESYNFDTFKKEKQIIDTTQIIKPSAVYPFSKMSKNEKQALFDGFTMQRNLFIPFPDFSFTLISENEIKKKDLENKLTVFVFWSPSSTKSIEAIPKINKMIEIYSENNITFYGFTESNKRNLEEFLIGTPFYADIISSSNSIFEDLYIPTINEPFILILNKEGKFIFGEELKEDSFEKMDYILSNEILK